MYYQLCANLFLNGLPHCEAHPLAVGARAGHSMVSLDGMDLPPGQLPPLPERPRSAPPRAGFWQRLFGTA